MSILWRRLTLVGFGRFEGPVTVRLSPGLNVLIAPNERGKSTLMAGLAAVLFGLPATADETQFGQGKLRHWREPARFEGELHFERRDETYRVRRRFADHAVTVSRRTDAGWQDVVVGEHNPRARRPNEAYAAFLRDVVGVDHVDLFWSVFAFGSPLPEADELDARVQSLVSGAGGARYHDGLERLRQASFALTKFSRDSGVAAQDRRKDGLVEQLRAEEEARAARLEASRKAVDERQEVQRRMHEGRQAREAARTRREEAEAALDAWTAWRDARGERRRALAEQSDALRAWERYNELGRRLEREAARLEETYPEAAGAPADAEDKLARLQRLEAEADRERAARRAAVASLVERAGEKLAAWRNFVARREELGRMRSRLRDEYAPFEAADEETRRAYARFETDKERLTRELEDARRARERAQAEAARRAAARARFASDYRDLAALDDDEVDAAIAQRLHALKRRDELLAEQRALFAARASAGGDDPDADGTALASGSRGWFRVGAGLAGALLVALVVYGAADAAWAGVALLLAAGAAAAWARRGFVPAAGRDEGEDAASRAAAALAARLAAVEEDLAPDPRLGPFAEADAHDLGVLTQRLAARRRAAAELERQDEGEGDEGPTPVAKRAWTAAEKAWRSWSALVGPAVEAYGETGVAAAYAAWGKLREEAARLESELKAWSDARFGQATLRPEETVLHPPPGGSVRSGAGDGAEGEGPGAVWRALARLAAVAAVPGPAAEEAAPGAEAGTGAAPDGPAGVTVGRLTAALSDWTGSGAESVVALAVSDDPPTEGAAETAALRRELAALLEAAGGDVEGALNRCRQYRAARAGMEELRAQQKGLLSGRGVHRAEELHERAVDRGNRAESARRRMEALSEEHPALPEPDGADDGEEVQARLDALRREAAAAKAEEAAADDAYRELLEREAALTGTAVVNIAAEELELRRLRNRRRRAQFDAEATALAYRELVEAAAEYEQSHRDVLAERASRYWRRFTGRDRTVVLDERFQVKIQDPDGPVHSVARLSQGARDQLYLALRLAVADLVAGEAPLPLLLDDPFVHCDGERLARIREALATVEEGRQVVLFSHREELAPWGRPVTPEGEGWENS